MTVNKYLTEKLGLEKNSTKQIICLIGEVVGEGHTKQIMYRSSPVWCYWELLEHLNHAANPEKNILNFNVLNTQAFHPSWMSGVDYNPAIRDCRYISILCMSSEELGKYYSEEQWKNNIKYIDEKIEKALANGTDPNLVHKNRKLGRVGMSYGK